MVAGDYPATVLPWLRLRDQGVTVRAVQPAGPVLTADDVAASISDRTRVLALTWVNSFTGHAVDLDPIGDLCRGRDVAVVVNASQALGARPFDAASTAVDAVVWVRLTIAISGWPPPVSMSPTAKATSGSARTCSPPPRTSIARSRRCTTSLATDLGDDG